MSDIIAPILVVVLSLIVIFISNGFTKMRRNYYYFVSGSCPFHVVDYSKDRLTRCLNPHKKEDRGMCTPTKCPSLNGTILLMEEELKHGVRSKEVRQRG